MLRVGLTGGIGSGKTTVSNMFRELGVKVIDADDIVREMTETDDSVISQIREYFGEDAIGKDGNLDKKYLRKIVFEDASARTRLEAILHPLVYNEIGERIKRLDDTYCIISVPLLLETYMHALVDRILVVDLPLELQITRAAERDLSDPDSIRKIAESQIGRKKRISQADDIINNEGDFDTLKEQVIKLHKLYMTLSGKYNPIN